MDSTNVAKFGRKLLCVSKSDVHVDGIWLPGKESSIVNKVHTFEIAVEEESFEADRIDNVDDSCSDTVEIAVEEESFEADRIDNVDDSCSESGSETITSQVGPVIDTQFNTDSLNPELHNTYMANMIEPRRVNEKVSEIISAIKSLSKSDVKVVDIGAGSGAVYSALKEEVDHNDEFPVIYLTSVEAAQKEFDYLQEHCKSVEGKLIHNVVLENGILPDPERQDNCDVLILNSVVHEIISYGAPKHVKYDRGNLRAFMRAWTNKVSTDGYLFFRDFVKPSDSWLDARVTIRPKTDFARGYLPKLVDDLIDQYKDMNPLKVSKDGSAISGKWGSIMEIMASFQWGSEGFRQSVIDEQFIHFSVAEIVDIAGEYGFELRTKRAYTSPPYFQKWISNFDIYTTNETQRNIWDTIFCGWCCCNVRSASCIDDLPPLKASMLFQKTSFESVSSELRT